MARWTDIAPRQVNTNNHNGPMSAHMGLVLHIAQGSYEGTIAWGQNPRSNYSSHFVVAKDGRIAQLVDTTYGSWCQSGGNQTWLSVENEGYVPDALTPAQLTANARILAKISQVYGVPLQVSTSPGTKGLGHHSMGGSAWGQHPACPGQAIINQKPELVAAARAILGGARASSPQPTQEEKIMFLIRYSKSPTVFLSDGVTARPIASEAELADIQTLAGEGTLKLGYGGRVRVVGRQSLVGRIVGPVPAGFENQGA